MWEGDQWGGVRIDREMRGERRESKQNVLNIYVKLSKNKLNQ